MKKRSMEALNRPDLGTFRDSEKLPVVVVLDNVRSALNVGSAFRTADGFAVEKIILCGITAQPPHREILKTALGATDSVTWIYMENAVEAARMLQSEGYRVIGVEQAEGSVMLDAFLPETNTRYALFFGNEVSGVSDEVLEIADGCIEIPQSGTKHSLNIAVCVGVVVWEFFRQYHAEKGQ